MTSKRLYYQDAYKTRFKANITSRIQQNGQTAVLLDQTYFYPTSGGQPHDLGKINEVPVLDVTVQESDGDILHWVGAGDIWSDEVVGDIDWPRRFDHMQQHSGQHILSQAFIRAAEAETVSFHLSDQSVTIDLQTTDIQPDQIEYAEHLANQVIWQNRQILIRAASLEEAKELPLRKIPPIREGKIRLIEVEDFDITACGGTHVARTGEIGLIKIVKLERSGDKLRVEFRCGQRALQDYRLKNSVVSRLMSELTTGAAELTNSVIKMQAENKQARRTIRNQQNVILRLEAESLLRKAKTHKKTRIISRAYPETELDAGQLKTIATQMLKEENVIILLGLAGEKSHLIFCRTEDAPGDMNILIKQALQSLGTASGGGTAVMAQGGGPPSDLERMEQALNRAERLLIGQLK